MNFMVFSEINIFNTVKANHQAYFDANSVDLHPVPLIDNNWMLNEVVLQNPVFTDFFTDLLASPGFDYEIRPVSQSEWLNQPTGP